MKKNEELICICLLILIIVIGMIFCSCVKEKNIPDGDYIAIAVIGGQHSNLESCIYPKINIDDKQDFINSNNRINKLLGVVPDGKPTEGSINIGGINSVKECRELLDSAVSNGRWDTMQNYAQLLLNNFREQTPNDEEVDTYKAFKIVQTEFSQLESEEEKRIVIYDSGLCTTGVLDFVDNAKYYEYIKNNHSIKDAEIKTITDDLKSQGELLDLKNVKIIWYGVGMVGGKQPELGENSKNNLKKIWEEILKVAGAEVDFIDVNPSGEEMNKDLPSVSVILFDECEILTENELGFEDGSDEFLKGTEESRGNLLRKFVRYANNKEILLVGTASSNGAKAKITGLDLSQRRADAVKRELIELGVDEKQIKTLGLGTGSHKYNANEFENGVYNTNSEAAKSNRSVYIMTSDSSEASMFYNDYEKIK